MVRRDRNEEPKLVSYVVPELKKWPQWLKDRGLEDVEDEGAEFGPTKVVSNTWNNSLRIRFTS